MLRAYLFCPVSRSFTTLKVFNGIINTKIIPLKEVTRSEYSTLYVTEMDECIAYEDGEVLTFVAYPSGPCFCYETGVYRRGQADCTDMFPNDVIKHPREFIVTERGYNDMWLEIHLVVDEDV